MLNFTDSDNDDILNQQSRLSERMKSNKSIIRCMSAILSSSELVYSLIIESFSEYKLSYTPDHIFVQWTSHLPS